MLFFKFLCSPGHWKMTTDPSLASGCDSEKGMSMQIKRERLVGDRWVLCFHLWTWTLEGLLICLEGLSGSPKEVPSRAHVEGRSALGSPEWPSWWGALAKALQPRGSPRRKRKSAKFFVRGKIIKRSPDFLKPDILRIFSLQSWALKCSVNNCTCGPNAPPALHTETSPGSNQDSMLALTWLEEEVVFLDGNSSYEAEPAPSYKIRKATCCYISNADPNQKLKYSIHFRADIFWVHTR